MAKLSKEQRRNKKKQLQRRAKDQARHARSERFGIMLEELCSKALPEYVDDSVTPDLAGRKILWQMGMIAWNIVVTGREELAEGAFAGSRLNDEQQDMVRREIDGLVARMRRLYPRETRSIRAVAVIFKNGAMHAKVQPGEEFPPVSDAREEHPREIPKGEEIFALRKQLKLTQVQFGAKIGVSARTISAWEHGKARPDAAEAAKIVEQARAANRKGLA